MGKSKAFKFAYRFIQSGKTTIQLFGTDREMTPDELEQMRRDINRNYFPVFVSLLWIVNQKTGVSIASSGASRLPKEPLFQVIENFPDHRQGRQTRFSVLEIAQQDYNPEDAQ